MKGFIAPVLVLMMTGTVFCQQHQSSNFSSSSNDSGIKLLRRFLLVMSDDHIRMLKTEGQLLAPIAAADQSTTDHIEFHGSDLNAQRTDTHPFNITQAASLDNDGRLEFMLSDALIEVMRKEGLRYIIREEDRGKYREVLVRYDGQLLNTNRISNPNLNREQVAQTRPTQQFGDRDSNRNPTRRSNVDLSRNFGERQEFRSNTRDDSPFVGPDLPDDYFERDRNNQFARTDTNTRFSRQTTPLTPRRETSYEDNFENRRIADRGIRRDDNSINLQPQTNRFNNNTIVTRDRERELALERENERLLAQQREDRLRREEEMLLGRRQDTRNDWQARPERNDLATENEKLKRMLLDERNDNVQRELDLERELDREYRTRLAVENDLRRRPRTDSDYQYGYDDRRAINFPSGRFPNRRENQYDDHLIDQYRQQDSYTQMPAKVAALPRPTNKPPAFSIPGMESNRQDATQTRVNRPIVTGDANEVVLRQNRLLWFMMLCSVGLNFYLAMLSRGFYVRYEELADEIRETFTSSV